MGDSNSQQPKVFLKILDRPNDAIQKLFLHDCNKSTKPLESRNLPKSFFTPPQDEHQIILHRKSNSSPCSMSQTIFQSMDIIDHNRQRSLDAAQHSLNFFHQSPMNSDVNKNVSESLTAPIGPLPAYYEMTINEKNQVYFLNHRDGETTWFDPRIPAEDQTYGMSLAELDKIHANFALKQELKMNVMETEKRHDNLSPPIMVQRCDPTPSRSTASCFQCIEARNCSPIACSLGFHHNNNLRPSSVPRIQQMISNTGKNANQSALYSRQSNSNSKNICKTPNGSLPPHGDQRLISPHIKHTKSSSQPVPMSTDQLEYYSGDCLCPSVWNPALNLSASMSGIFDEYSHLSTGSLTNSTSSHLAQHMEDLNLATNCPVMQLHQTCSDNSESLQATESCASTLQFRQKQQQYHGIFSAGQNIPPGNDVKITSSGEHSHQNSSDSGVGKSIAGQSVHSSNQTPMHLKDIFCNSDMQTCNMDPEMVDNMSYISNWNNQMNFYMTDQSNSTMEGGSDVQRSQHC